MSTKFFSVIMAAAALSISSCQNGDRGTQTEEPITAETPVKPDNVDVVTSSMTDDKGNTLDMKFDNVAGTATFVFNQDTIHLKQDTTASGIQYSNGNYKFTEHHGEATLTKDGNVVFTKK